MASSSYSGIPLYQNIYPAQNSSSPWNAWGTNTWGGQPIVEQKPTPAAGLMNNVMSGANQLTQLGQQGAGIDTYLGFNQGLAGRLAGMGKGLSNKFAGNLGWAQKALQQGFDPQKQYYKQAVGDLTEQSRAGQAARGIAMTPYGASVESNALGRFQNDWRDRQLGRQAMGAQTATGLQNQYLQGQLGAGQLMGAGGQLSQNNMAMMLQQYGLKGDNLAKAMGVLGQLFGNLRTDTSSGGGAINGPQPSPLFNFSNS